ncbi:MAG: hypothetical protein WA580_09905 [Acidimicrobiales bacterium]
MAQWFLRGLARGIVTTRYPKAIEPWAARLPTPPAFVVDRLNVEVAERLVSACPSGALRVDGATLIYDVGACTSCGNCERAVPGVIRPSGHFELAARSSAQLIKRFDLREGDS